MPVAEALHQQVGDSRTEQVKQRAVECRAVELLDVEVLLQLAEQDLDQPPERVDAHSVDRGAVIVPERRQVRGGLTVNARDGQPAEGRVRPGQLHELDGDPSCPYLVPNDDRPQPIDDVVQAFAFSTVTKSLPADCSS